MCPEIGTANSIQGCRLCAALHALQTASASVLPAPYFLAPEAAAVEAVVSLEESPAKVLSWEVIPGVHPLLTVDDCLEAERICREDPTVQVRAMARAQHTVVLFTAAEWRAGGRGVKVALASFTAAQVAGHHARQAGSWQAGSGSPRQRGAASMRKADVCSTVVLCRS
jgi:hypothetical protein